ncbi:MAG: hypothetical protein AAGJ38_01850 [Planctomycetota bacterium]
MQVKFLFASCLGIIFLSFNAAGEPVIAEADASGDLSSLNPPTLYGQQIDPDAPWQGRLRRVWAGALDKYREWEANQPAPTSADNTTPVPLPSAALGGLALLGGVGGLRAMRRPRTA